MFEMGRALVVIKWSIMLFIYNGYFKIDKPIFVLKRFRRHFRMSMDVFMRLWNLRKYDDYFIPKVDCTRKLWFFSIRKCTIAIQCMDESTCLEAMYKFYAIVVKVFGPEYLREPNPTDTTQLMAISAAIGFSKMPGSIDYIHWEWQSCLFGRQEQYKGHVKVCIVILEDAQDYELWIWHSFFSMA